MKKLIFIRNIILLLPLSLLFLNLCLFGQPKTDLEKMQLKGAVKTIVQDSYRQVPDSGKWIFKKGFTRILNFNKQGMLTDEKIGVAEITMLVIYHHYDTAGNEISTERFSPNGRPAFRITRQFDTKGNIIEQLTGGPNSQPERIGYRYDEKGHKTAEIRYWSDGRNYIDKTFLYDAYGHLTEEDSYKADGSRYTDRTYQYDTKGMLTERKSFKPDGNLWFTYVYTYDENGNTLEWNDFKANGNLFSKTSYQYEYDRPGNWIKRTTWEGKDEKLKTQTNQERRLLEYY